MRRPAALFLIALATLLPVSARADFSAFLEQTKRDALMQGISPQTASLLGDAVFKPRIIELDRAQTKPGGPGGLEKYLKRIVTADRVRLGREAMARHRDTLSRVEAEYGVPAQVVVAMWGVETNYGGYTGGFRVIDALATLAYEGRRAEFFRKELLTALKILDQGHVAPDAMLGSWAGAMGQVQFMPTTFQRWAVDHDGDGRRDIWNDPADAFASAANYLRGAGWQAGQSWGRAVKLPKNIDRHLIGLETQKSVDAWAKLGLRKADGSPLPASGLSASLIQPDGPGGAAYLVYDNFRVFREWNKSTYFALSAGLLSDRISRQAEPTPKAKRRANAPRP